jgi:hypothetical protein
MSYERAMDPNDDPERRMARARLEQLELPFGESARSAPDESPGEVQRAVSDFKVRFSRAGSAGEYPRPNIISSVDVFESNFGLGPAPQERGWFSRLLSSGTSRLSVICGALSARLSAGTRRTGSE